MRFVHVGSVDDVSFQGDRGLTPFISLKMPYEIKYFGYNKINFTSLGGKDTDIEVIEYCKNNIVDIVWLDVQDLDNNFDDNPVKKMCLKLLKNGILVIMCWSDSVWPGIKEKLIEYSKVCSFIIVLDNPSTISVDPYKIMWMWSFPNDFSIYRKPTEPRDIDVSFAGTIKGYSDRIEYLDYLISKKLNIFVCGQDSYIPDVFKRSKICLNFSRVVNGEYHQLKCRTIEIPAAGALFLESENQLTPLMYDIMEDFVPFSTPEDLLEKIKFYLGNDEERLRIATNGYNKCFDNYNMKNWWNKVFDRINVAKRECLIDK